ncbi:MAG: PaaX family transcriptional regulator C-terminal domain-containing protein [Microbacterium sp.]|uniref:PaaX family transcriptional regulator C-terminal domain-containing protein n=1 Tax=Microbacterium sp. TaxID=51671 RepID=UPI0039E46B2E
MARQNEGWATSASTTLRTILTEFALPRTGGLPHAAVVRVMEIVGFEPAAARQALSRAARAGALERPPVARRGEVLLSDDGRALLQRMLGDADQRDAAADWDGTWTLVAIRGRVDRDPEHATRNRLLLETFGSLGGGMWIAPHGPRAQAAVEVLAGDSSFQLLSGSVTFDRPSLPELVATAWDLTAARTVYEEFLEVASSLSPSDPEQTLAAWIVMRRQWYAVTHADPELPPAGLPDDWPGLEVRVLLERRRAQWWPIAEEAFRALL